MPVVRADEIRRTRDAEGNRKVIIEGSPERSSKSARENQNRAADRLSVDASLERRDLRRALEAKTEQLGRIRGQIRDIENESITLQVGSLPTEAGEARRAIESERQAFLALRTYEAKQRERLERLRAEERRILREILDVWASFQELEARVVEAFGGAPPWWRGDPECGECPTEKEAREQLLERSEE